MVRYDIPTLLKEANACLRSVGRLEAEGYPGEVIAARVGQIGTLLEHLRRAYHYGSAVQRVGMEQVYQDLSRARQRLAKAGAAPKGSRVGPTLDVTKPGPTAFEAVRKTQEWLQGLS
jgi:hypothetical protein